MNLNIFVAENFLHSVRTLNTPSNGYDSVGWNDTKILKVFLELQTYNKYSEAWWHESASLSTNGVIAVRLIKHLKDYNEILLWK
jgi:hypothetical protein